MAERASTLLEACTALAATDIIVPMDDKVWTFKAAPVEMIKSQYSPGELPIRLVLQPGVYDRGISEFTYKAKLVTVRWNVVDLLLFESVKLGAEIGRKYHVLMGYLGEYVATMNQNRNLAKGCFIANVFPVGGNIINFPRGSNYYYNGVQFVVQIDETIC